MSTSTRRIMWCPLVIWISLFHSIFLLPSVLTMLIIHCCLCTWFFNSISSPSFLLENMVHATASTSSVSFIQLLYTRFNSFFSSSNVLASLFCWTLILLLFFVVVSVHFQYISKSIDTCVTLLRPYFIQNIKKKN